MKISDVIETLLIVQDLIGDINVYIESTYKGTGGGGPIKIMREDISVEILSDILKGSNSDFVCHIGEKLNEVSL